MLTGFWWKKTDEPRPSAEKRFVSLDGDPHAISRRWPLLWRWQWKWHLFEVNLSKIPEGESRGYFIYCQVDGEQIRTRRWVTTEYFFARLGPENHTFWVAHVGRHNYDPLPITQVPHKNHDGVYGMFRSWKVRGRAQTKWSLEESGLAVAV